MRVLLVGSGGREQALALNCRTSGHEVVLCSDAAAAVDHLASVDLVIPGPEAALVAGIATTCAAAGVPCFGPSAELARLESSKAHARDVTTRLGIPGPRWSRFDADSVEEAMAWWRDLGSPVVVKQDGLAAGKGVVVPTDDDATVEAITALSARGAFLLEERMSGPECSLLALCDGSTAVALPLAQDHKRIGEGDRGPNTGGMGAYAPAPLDVDVDELVATFITPVLDDLRSAGTPYVGVLYAGLMITPTGPRLVEYNCRFGDPEAQAVIPMLDCDLADVALAATEGALSTHAVATGVPLRAASACTVVAAAPGYPGTPAVGAPVLATTFSSTTTAASSLDDELALLFPAGIDGEGRVSGGRVLAVTGLGDDLGSARDRAYTALDGIAFEGMQVRRDIGWRAPGATMRSYAESGVDIDEGTRAVDGMRDAVERTLGPDVLRGVGSFGGVISLARLSGLEEPVLVASTDGVGTKVELAARLGRVRGVGADIVNHCIDDVLVQSARPLMFLDYIAASRLDAELVAEVVSGMAEACEAAGCALLGGETAEMPGVYADDAFDVAGTLIGFTDRAALLPTDDIGPGDVLLALASSGPHTNGYSLLRRLFQWFPMDAVPVGLDRPLGEALLEPHRSYLDVIVPLLDAGDGPRVKGLAHITGGGLPENLPRVLPDGVDAEVTLGSWPVPPLFALVRDLLPGMDTHELHRTLNMGVGMVIVCAEGDVEAMRDTIEEDTWVIGRLVEGRPGHSEVHLR